MRPGRRLVGSRRDGSEVAVEVTLRPLAGGMVAAAVRDATPWLRAPATGVTQLALGLDIQVVAEGVETPEQQQLVQDVGCSLVQGYHLAVPTPLTELRRTVLGQPPRPDGGPALTPRRQ